MANHQKQAELKSKQDELRQEISTLVTQNRHGEAIKFYQKKCGCSFDVASRYVDQISNEQRAKRREDFLSRQSHRRLHAFA